MPSRDQIMRWVVMTPGQRREYESKIKCDNVKSHCLKMMKERLSARDYLMFYVVNEELENKKKEKFSLSTDDLITFLRDLVCDDKEEGCDHKFNSDSEIEAMAGGDLRINVKCCKCNAYGSFDIDVSDVDWETQ